MSQYESNINLMVGEIETNLTIDQIERRTRYTPRIYTSCILVDGG